MADETFRPKKPIDPSEVSEGGESLQEVQQQVRRAAAEEVGRDAVEPGGESSMAVDGVVPQQFKEALARQRNDDDDSQSSPTAPAPKAKRKKKATNEPNLRTTGSNKLEELLQDIQVGCHCSFYIFHCYLISVVRGVEQ